MPHATSSRGFDGHPSEITSLLGALQELLTPIARMLVNEGIGAKHTVDAVKRAYVSATIDVLKERGIPVTPARLGVFTALTVGEIERILADLESPLARAPLPLTYAGQVLSVWHVDKRYTVPFTDLPADLPFDATQGRESFSLLVRECAPDASPRDVLDEMIGLGVVRINEDSGKIQPLARTLIHSAYSPTAAARLGRIVRNLTETLYNNFQASDPRRRRFERNVNADFPVSAETEDQFRELVRIEGQKLIATLDKWLLEQEPVAENSRRVGAEVFEFLEIKTGLQPTPRRPPGDVKKSSGSAPTHTKPIPEEYFDSEGVIDVLKPKGPA
jgi:Family of unknown function (DUF6502)